MACVTKRWQGPGAACFRALTGLCLVDAPKAGEASLISRLGSLVVLLALAALFSEQAAVPSLVASCKENARPSSSENFRTQYEARNDARARRFMTDSQ